MKKKNRTTIVSLNKGKAEIKAETRSLSPSIFVIVLRGLNTLRALKDEIFPSPDAKKLKYPEKMMKKSRAFHASLIYEPRLRTKPIPRILSIISRV